MIHKHKRLIAKIPVEVWVHPDDLGRRDGLEGLSLARFVVDYMNDALSWGFRLVAVEYEEVITDE